MPASARKIAVALAVGLTGFDTGTRAHDVLAGVDANIVTALDISDSIGRYEEWLEQTGTARAVLHPAFLEAVANGHHGQIGFAVYTWSDGGEYQVIVPWTRIDGPAAARSVAETIQSFRLIDRSDYAGTDDQTASELNGGGPASVSGGPQGGMTDVSGALAFGHGMLQAAPYSASRHVINLFTDTCSPTASTMSARGRTGPGIWPWLPGKPSTPSPSGGTRTCRVIWPPTWPADQARSS